MSQASEIMDVQVEASLLMKERFQSDVVYDSMTATQRTDQHVSINKIYLEVAMICLRRINLEDTMDGFSYELSKCESNKILKIRV